MGGLLFSNAMLLAGLGALVGPILIHLLLKQKPVLLRFSSILLLQTGEEEATRRRKLRNWLLLLLRLVLLTLLVLAFARPYLPASPAAQSTDQRRQIVFVLDRSASMQAGDRWTRATDWLQKTVARLTPADRVAIIDARTPADILAPLGPPDALKPVLQKLQPGFGTSDLAEGVNAAVRLLAGAEAGGTLRIEVISDFQESACARLAEAAVPKRIELTLCPMAEGETPNQSVEELTSDQAGQSVTARAVNHSWQDVTSSRLTLRVDGSAKAMTPISLMAGMSTQISLALPQLTPGWHSVEARFAVRDDFALDDARYRTVYVPKPQRVLCVEPRTDRHVFDQETFFVATALVPETNHTGPYAVDTVPPADAVGRLATGEYTLVVLPGLRELPAGLPPALSRFVTDGGGLILFAGEKLNAGRYHEELHDLLPALPGQMEGDDDQPEKFWHLGHYQRDGLIFAAFKEQNSGDFTLPVFRHRFTLTPLADSRTEAEFNDGTPLIISKQLGRGRIVLVNTSADTRWTDWPKRKTFLPWFYGLATYAMQRTGAPDPGDNTPLLAGSPAEVALGAAATNLPVQVRDPAGQIAPATADARGHLAFNPEPPGIYSIQDSAGHELRRVAVNLAASESDLRPVAPGEINITRTDDAPPTSLVAGMLGNDRRELWRFLLLAAVAVLFLEPLLANRSYS
jgi:hypothetical protein